MVVITASYMKQKCTYNILNITSHFCIWAVLQVKVNAVACPVWRKACLLYRTRYSKLKHLHHFYIEESTFFYHGTTAPSGPGPPHYLGFAITLRHTTLGRTPLDQWSARRRDLYLTTHTIHMRETSMLRRDSNPQSQQKRGRRLTP